MVLRHPLQHAAVLVTALLCFSAGVQAQDYHVAPNGSDSASGSLGAPLRTIQRAADLMVAGDTCYIRAGTYRESIRPARSGAAGAAITFRPYRDERVVIVGTERVTGWVRDGAHWRAPMPGDFYVSRHNYDGQVFVDGEMRWCARWPNAGQHLTSTAAADKSIGKSLVPGEVSSRDISNGRYVYQRVFDDPRLPAVDVRGASVYLQPDHTHWSWVTGGVVSGQSGRRITLDLVARNGNDGKGTAIPAGARYFLYGKRSLIDSDGEWYHDKDAGMIYMQSSVDPDQRTVEARARDYAFDLTDRSYITIAGLRLFACTITTDRTLGDGRGSYPDLGYLSPAHHIRIERIEARYPSHFTDVTGGMLWAYAHNTGIVLSGSDNVIRDSVIEWSAGNGISLLGVRSKAINNRITNVGYMGCDHGGIGTGWTMYNHDCEIAYNTISECGRSGMVLRHMQNSRTDSAADFKARIHHNVVSNYGREDWDVGAFYTYGQDGRFLRIDHNVFSCDYPATGMVFGAYFDFSKNYVLDHNVIYGVPCGIQVTKAADNQSTSNLLVYNNTVRSNSSRWSRPLTKSSGAGAVFKNNIFEIAVFRNGGLVNHWPAYGDHAPSVIRNLVYNYDPTGYWGLDQKHPSDVLVDDPRFEDAAAGDYRLGSGSPAIDQGSLFGTYTRDGISVPPFNDPVAGSKPDIGAFERGKPAWNAGAVDPGPGAGGGGSGTGLVGAYHAGMTFGGTPLLQRTDARIDFDWGSGSPAGGIPVDGFAVRWSGEIEAPVGGTYTFTTRSDDGVRLWIDDRLVIDAWVDQAPTDHSGTIALEAGSRSSIRMEYYEQRGGAVAQLRWRAAGLPEAVVPQDRLYPTGTVVPAVAIAINFQPASAPVPSGWSVDGGAAFGARGGGLSYGWDQANDETRDRNADADQVRDTLNHLQKQGARTWEIALPNGTYAVTLLCGDPVYRDQVNHLLVEGQRVADPDGADRFDEYLVQVQVADGRLTLRPASDASNAKICSIEIAAPGDG